MQCGSQTDIWQRYSRLCPSSARLLGLSGEIFFTSRESKLVATVSRKSELQEPFILMPNYLIDGPLDPVIRLTHKAPYDGLSPWYSSILGRLDPANKPEGNRTQR